MKYEIQIANKELLKRGEGGFAMSKLTDDLDRAFTVFNDTKKDYGHALVVRVINKDNGLVIIESK